MRGNQGVRECMCLHTSYVDMCRTLKVRQENKAFSLLQLVSRAPAWSQGTGGCSVHETMGCSGLHASCTL